MNIRAATDELHKAFSLLNKRFFNGELPEPAITIQTSGKRLSMGWCSVNETWFDQEGKIKKYELNISAEYLNIEFLETMDTMLHEMVHLYCAINGIKDTSRNNTYHNKKFKEECLKRGFYFPDEKPDKKYGWAFPKITEETRKICEAMNIDSTAFVIARKRPQLAVEDEKEGGEDEKERKKSFKWVCPGCAIIVRSTKKEIRIACADCLKALVLQE